MSKIVMFGSFVVDLMGRAGKLPGPERLFLPMDSRRPRRKGFQSGSGRSRAGGDLE